MKLLYTFLILLLHSLNSYTQTVKEYDSIDSFYARINQDEDTLYVVNFWATWCAPCVKELPHLLVAEQKLKDQPTKFIFLSLDFKKDIQKRLIPFINKRKILSEVAVLTDTDANRYVDFINKEWDGAIPATMLYKNTALLKFTQHEFESPSEVINFVTSK
ncbi:MAG TPA: TlpA disulfide reductase family protein [Saprospiraceae bacterium]|nr:TlpA disulfide reductase family protein [Saprospiraceae bacterium]